MVCARREKVREGEKERERGSVHISWRERESGVVMESFRNIKDQSYKHFGAFTSKRGTINLDIRDDQTVCFHTHTHTHTHIYIYILPATRIKKQTYKCMLQKYSCKLFIVWTPA